jgi:hypothetical protein
MEQLADTKTEYLTALDGLYDDVDDWVKIRGFETVRGLKEIREEEFGIYEAPTLEIKLGERFIARLDPIGASIVGADGRVDLKGRVTSEIISLFEKPRPSIAISDVFNEEVPKQRMYPFYPEVTEPGWYWIQFRVRGRAHRMSKELFIELLDHVSNNATYQ